MLKNHSHIKLGKKDALQRHLDADEKMNKIDMKIRYYDVELKFLEEVIKTISNRTFQIKMQSNGKSFRQVFKWKMKIIFK